MQNWESLYRDVSPYVSGCSELELDHALLRAAQHFFSRTRVWTLWLDEINTSAGVMEYDLNLESKSELVRIERATLNAQRLTIQAEGRLPANWREYPNQAGVCQSIHTTDRKTVVLLPPPGDGLLLQIQACLKPSNNAVGIENRFYDQYALAIATGAKSMLMLQPGMPFSNPSEGLRLESEFNGKMAAISIQNARGFSSHRPRLRGRYF
ncbi:hypothetical protein [Undibacterium umbellatum]|uniref:Uncharacterized protein n=1 Tax=Undibacterium umbellatum TaxID=2762300 RepID=A0ABR6Z354_9BURK|nr:hypothetical protein [Undibacterium umbellatum]MBC3906208.1 hypothetical protein [Undibacterium umbellatum]